MTIKLGIVMDPIAGIKPQKDTTLALMLAAQARGWQLYVMEQDDLFLKQSHVYANVSLVTVRDDTHSWFTVSITETIDLTTLDVILMRKDPPVDLKYIYTTHLLEQVEAQGVLVVNKPQGLRNANEKLFTQWFPECCPPTLVTSQRAQLLDFLEQQQDIIIKPLDAMGGQGVFRLRQGDVNIFASLEMLSHDFTLPIMAQRFIPEITQGDKRIIIINGELMPYGLARIPVGAETRGNLARGGKGVVVPITDRERWIGEQIAPRLRHEGLILVGIDVIGNYLTEINVTSPTCVREIEKESALDITGKLLTWIEETLHA